MPVWQPRQFITRSPVDNRPCYCCSFVHLRQVLTEEEMQQVIDPVIQHPLGQLAPEAAMPYVTSCLLTYLPAWCSVCVATMFCNAPAI